MPWYSLLFLLTYLNATTGLAFVTIWYGIELLAEALKD